MEIQFKEVISDLICIQEERKRLYQSAGITEPLLTPLATAALQQASQQYEELQMLSTKGLQQSGHVWICWAESLATMGDELTIDHLLMIETAVANCYEEALKAVGIPASAVITFLQHKREANALSLKMQRLLQSQIALPI